VFQAIW